MRENMGLYRGKWNGSWVKGAFCPKNCDDPFGPMVDKPSIIKLDKPNDGFWFDVDPDTVGQYTGLNDKNGVLIFEGDILKVTWGDASGKPLASYLVVVFENGAFTTMHTKADTQFGLVSTYTAEQLGCCGVFCEVIGNIWDNPELVEVQHEN